jgi:F0F1-type ATP synthase assembly protein I
LLTGGEAWNIAILSGTLRIANANCLSFICSIHFSKRSSFDERFSFYAAAKMKIHFTIPLEYAIINYVCIFLQNFTLQRFYFEKTFDFSEGL